MTIFSILLGTINFANAQEADSTAAMEESMMEARQPGGDPALDLEIGQLIIDNTFSKAGNDFQQLFNTKWNWPTEDQQQFILTISERPSFVNSTIVEISINDLKVFESFLQPRYDIIEETVDQAIGITLQYILNYEEVLRELSGEDLSGSGIY